ncbi:MAG: hypothetical protein VYC82_07910, partial [Verrucomicrobiota bacterium]|nr:hypothetical protein [Verrucomicrobiota bacterium]
MKSFNRILLLSTVIAASTALADWPQWRGPEGTGISTATNLPTNWSEDSNVAWKIKMPAWSGSTPIVIGGRVF